MKYAHLIQIASFLSNFKKINDIKRVGDMLLCISFDSQNIFFDLAKSGSAIYKNDNFKEIKIYNAPFDNILAKRFKSSKILDIKCLENNRILKITTKFDGSYKSLTSNLYLEFTGRFTNAIITDENGLILEALRHIDNNLRTIKPNHKLKELESIEIKEKKTEPIADINEFLKDEFNRINSQNLANLKEIKIAQIQKKLDTLNANLNALENESELNQQSEILRQKASVLLANLSNLKEFERDFRLLDFNGQDIRFTLEDSPKNSANSFFLKAKKLTQKALGVNLERENLNEKIKFYSNLQTMLKKALSISELQILYPKAKNQKFDKSESENIKNFYIKEFKISIGRNENGNIELLKNAKKDDIWLHLKDLPSPHVIIKSNKLKIDDEILNFGAKLCLNFSNVKAGRYEIDYTKRKNIKVQNGANVNYVDFKTIILTKE
ncbi:NFACT family protein [Campylobacter mucosalis]|uniref:NFACT family protein n=1 Tax=Campylobacter mucosalis TaxID=202 RepID=UPI0014701C55|nr:NFACT family protein [Campylobacter mucosalis]